MKTSPVERHVMRRREPRRILREKGPLGLLVAAAFLCLGSQASVAQGSIYRLGSQDKLRMYVHEWPVLTGEFTIGASGALSLPMIGEVPAAGLRTSELVEAVSERLQKQANQVNPPRISIEVVQYRPFYILGGVDRPGEYAYRPGMTVLHAMSIAGGLYRPAANSAWTFERDAIQALGDVQVHTLHQEVLLAREIRLKAEADGLTTVTFPPQMQQRETGASNFIDQERAIFQTRLEKHLNQLQTSRQIVVLYEKEIEALQAQIAAEQKQVHLVRKELDDVRTYVTRGLATAPRILPLERTIAQIEGKQRELESSIIRARQQINQAQQQATTLRDERRASATEELKVLQAQLKEAVQRHETAQRVMAGASASVPSLDLDDSGPTVIYTIVRNVNEEVRHRTVHETATVEPGDVVKVRVLRSVTSGPRTGSVQRPPATSLADGKSQGGNATP